MLIICPHCNKYIEIIEINCGIFRHGTYKSNNEQIDPHLKKEECDNLRKTLLTLFKEMLVFVSTHK